MSGSEKIGGPSTKQAAYHELCWFVFEIYDLTPTFPGRCGVSPQKGTDETPASAAGERLPLLNYHPYRFVRRSTTSG